MTYEYLVNKKVIVPFCVIMILSIFRVSAQYDRYGIMRKEVCIKDSVLNVPVSYAVLFFDHLPGRTMEAITADINGNVSFDMPTRSDIHITVSRFGYISKTINILGLTDTILLKPESILLGEITVKASKSGYGKRLIRNAFNNVKHFFYSGKLSFKHLSIADNY